MVEIIDYAVDILKRRGYLTDDDLRPGLRGQRINAAVEKYRTEHPYVPPLYPSIEYPGEEARCRDCLDGGYIARVHHDGLHTQTEYLVCHCQTKKRAAERIGQSGVPEKHQDTCFETWMPVDGLDAADFNAITNFAQGKADFVFVLIYGTTGNGKTFLAYATVVEAAKKGIAAKYIGAPELFLSIRAGYESPRIDDPAETWKECPMLVVDDYGAHETDWMRGMLEEILDYRYSHELPTMLTTNKDPKSLPGPVLSRFKDAELSRIIHNAARDYRPRKKGK